MNFKYSGKFVSVQSLMSKAVQPILVSLSVIMVFFTWCVCVQYFYSVFIWSLCVCLKDRALVNICIGMSVSLDRPVFAYPSSIL